MADMLRVDWVPECYMAPPEIRDLPRVLRYRNLVVREAAYFESLLGSPPEQVSGVPESLVGLLKMSHGMIEMLAGRHAGETSAAEGAGKLPSACPKRVSTFIVPQTFHVKATNALNLRSLGIPG